MTSANSMYKSGFSAAFIKTFKQRIAGVAALFILNTVFSLAMAFILVFDYRKEPTVLDIDLTYEAILITFGASLISTAYNFFASSRYFKEIYKKRDCDFYFSAPIKREEYFNANFLFGAAVNIISITIPAALFCIYVKFQMLSKVNFSINLNVFAVSSAAMLLACLVSLSVFIMCAVISGKRVHYIVLSIICVLFAPVAFAKVADRVNTIWGVMLDPANFEALSPAGNLFKVMGMMREFSKTDFKAFIPLFAILIIEFFGMYAAGRYIFKRRKAEIAEVAITGKVIPFIILAVLLLFAFVNTAFSSNMVVSVIVGIASAAIAAMIFTFIFYRKPFIKQTAVTLAAAGILSACFVICVNTSSFSKYVSYVPDVSEVESIELSEADDYSYSSSIDRILGISYFSYYGGDNSLLNFKSYESIKNVVEMHKKIVAEETIKASNTASDLFDAYTDYSSDTYYCKIIYNLKNGKQVTRSYAVDAKSVFEEYVKVMKTEEAVNQILPYSLGKEDILFATISGSDEEAEYYDDYNYLPSESLIPADMDYNKLIDCIKADKLANNNQAFLDSMYNSFGMNYYPASYYYTEPYTSVIIYVWDDGISEEEKAEYSEMTPAQLKKLYDESYRKNIAGSTDEILPVYQYFVEILPEDKNTIAYLSDMNQQ